MMKSLDSASVLYIVATPIGNLDEISFRAIYILTNADLILAEDKRKTSILLNHYKIKAKRLISYHSHNIDKITVSAVNDIFSHNLKAAIVTDAGTPGISDPGALLIKQAIEKGIKVSPISGPSALLAALSGSGFPSHKFLFEGFLPLKKGREKLFKSWIDLDRSLIFYESPNRLLKTLKEIWDITGDRKVAIGREISKMYEEFIRGDLSSIIESLEKREKIKGEVTVVIAPANF